MSYPLIPMMRRRRATLSIAQARHISQMRKTKSRLAGLERPRSQEIESNDHTNVWISEIFEDYHPSLQRSRVCTNTATCQSKLQTFFRTGQALASGRSRIFQARLRVSSDSSLSDVVVYRDRRLSWPLFRRALPGPRVTCLAKPASFRKT